MDLPTRSALTVGLVQIGELTWTRRRRKQWKMEGRQLVEKPQSSSPSSFVYLPYSVGILQGYVQKHAQAPEQFTFLPFIYSPVPVRDAVDQLRQADVVGFSLYVWNVNLSLAIAKALKAANPDVIIMAGGPQVPDRAEPLAAFLRQHPELDVVCHGEGEQVFLALLERVADGKRTWEDLPSVSYLDDHGRVHTAPRIQRLRALDDIPSPFLEGVFEPTMSQNPQHRWLVMWETNRGCPFSCTFCDWGSATASKVARFPLDRLKAEIQWFADRGIEHLFICDANFGMLPRDAEIAREIVDVNKARGIPIVVSVQNTKNARERSYTVQTIFSEITTAGVTISLQSIDPQVLVNIKRDNISLDTFLGLQQQYARDGIPTYTDLILGLPGESYDSFTYGISQVIKYGQHNRLAIYNCSILPNAEMGDPNYLRRFGMKTRPIRIIHEHGLIEAEQRLEHPETIDNVVETDAMPEADWIRAKAFAWLADMLYFNRLFQMAFVILVEQYGLTYKQLFEAILYADAKRYPTCGWIRERLYAQAHRNHQGEPEYVADPQRLGAWWPMPQHLFILTAEEGRLDALYSEVEQLCIALVMMEGKAPDFRMIHECFMLNRLMVRLPHIFHDLTFPASYNLYEVYNGTLQGYHVPIQRVKQRYHIDRTSSIWLSWEDWYEDIVLRNYRRDDYLYRLRPLILNEQVAPIPPPKRAIAAPVVAAS